MKELIKSGSKSCAWLRIVVLIALAAATWIIFTETNAGAKIVTSLQNTTASPVIIASDESPSNPAPASENSRFVKLEEVDFKPVTANTLNLQNDILTGLETPTVTADLDQTGINSVQVLSNVSRVFYNRVPKCGSRTILRVMDELTARHKINNYHSEVYNIKQLNGQQELDYVTDFMNHDAPLLHDRHVYFIDFNEHGEEMPIYINLIRDPFERLLSRHYYILYESKRTPQETKEAFNMTFAECVEQNLPICMSPVNLIELLRYFCGHEAHCESKGRKNNAIILNRAKTHVSKYYAVVGVIEEAEDFFFLLEKRMPHLFKGAVKVYQDIVSKMKVKYRNSQKIMPTEEIKLKVKAQMQEAYDFYNFVKQRQYNMLVALGKKTAVPPKTIA